MDCFGKISVYRDYQTYHGVTSIHGKLSFHWRKIVFSCLFAQFSRNRRVRRMQKRWGSDIHYGFAYNRGPMWLLGTWPLQKNNYFCKFRWSVIILIEFGIAITLLVEIFFNCGDTSNFVESVLILTSVIHSANNSIIPRIYSTRLATNMNSAIEDWSVFRVNKKFYSTMKRYARIGRLLSMSQLTVGYIGFCVFFASVVLRESEEKLDPALNITLVKRKFIIPAACLAGGVSQQIYGGIIVLQIGEVLLLIMGQCSTDSFFFNVTLHLCGQLEILRQRFVEFDRRTFRESHESKDEKHELRNLIRRHCTLIQLGENLEESYNISVLLQLLLAACSIAVTGIRLILSIRHKDNVEILKSLIVLLFSILQRCLVSCSGDLLMHHSESIFLAVCNTSWHKLRPRMAKDLLFVMMRARIPLRITGGKFIYVSRKTMTDILKTAMSYISFLQLTITDVD